MVSSSGLLIHLLCVFLITDAWFAHKIKCDGKVVASCSCRVPAERNWLQGVRIYSGYNLPSEKVSFKLKIELLFTWTFYCLCVIRRWFVLPGSWSVMSDFMYCRQISKTGFYIYTSWPQCQVVLSERPKDQLNLWVTAVGVKLNSLCVSSMSSPQMARCLHAGFLGTEFLDKKFRIIFRPVKSQSFYPL